jgi:hypothetical protein
MRSVADALRRQDREELLRLSPAERVRLALALGERDLEAFRAAHSPALSRHEAARRLDRRRQLGRQPSGCMAALAG